MQIHSDELMGGFSRAGYMAEDLWGRNFWRQIRKLAWWIIAMLGDELAIIY